MKHLFFAFIAVLTVGAVAAQSQNEITITASKPISKSETPQQIIKAVETKFPDAKAIQYFKTPTNAIKNGWVVTEDGSINPDSRIDHYTISFKRANVQYFGLYAADGTLEQGKYEEDQAKLPPAVKQTLSNLAKQHPEYTGYTVDSKTYYRTQDYSKKKDFYEIIVSQGGKNKKKIYVAPDGMLIKVK